MYQFRTSTESKPDKTIHCTCIRETEKAYLLEVYVKDKAYIAFHKEQCETQQKWFPKSVVTLAPLEYGVPTQMAYVKDWFMEKEFDELAARIA